MIIKRKQKKIHPRDLYFVSPLDNLDGEFLYPSIPNNVLTRNKWEDWKTKRISLFPSISGALMYLSSQGTSLKGKTLTVYSPVSGSMESLMKPGIQDSPVSEGTGEYWYLSGIKLREIAKIEVLSKKKGEKIIYHYGPRSTTGYLEEWEWREILKPWEKEGKLKEKEFGVVSDLIHSGLPRTYKKYVGRARRNLGNKIGRSIGKDAEKFIESGENIKSADIIYNKDAGDTLYKKASELSAHIYKSPEREAINSITGLPVDRVNYTRDSNTIVKGFRKQIGEQFNKFNGRYPTEEELNEIIRNLGPEDKALYKNLVENRNAIVLDDVAKGEKPEILAHEIGHLINKGSKKGMKVDRLANSVDNNFNSYNHPLFTTNNSEQLSMKNTLKKSINNYIEQRRVIKNESLANKSGLSLIRDDLNKEEMSVAKKNLKNSLNTYKYKGRMYYKEPLWRKIQIPSLRDPNKILPDSAIKKLNPPPRANS